MRATFLSLVFFSKTLGLAASSSLPLAGSARLQAARKMSSAQRMFQLRVDPLTGNSEWLVVEEDGGEAGPKDLLATTSYLDMLNDRPRNRAFREAIEKTVTNPCHVIDIGAGTGLLSMIAARAMTMMMGESGASSSFMASPGARGMVTACESYLPMAKLMRKVLHVNRMGKAVDVINKRSDELRVGVDIPSRADILVSEILDSELLGEGLIPTLQHAHDCLLVENASTVPYRAVTYGQLVESPSLWKLHDLHGNEALASDGVHLVPTGLDTILRVKRQQHPMHCDSNLNDIKLLSEPFKVFEFDFWKRPDSYGESKLLVKTTGQGRVHAVVSWWVLQLDHEGTIFYSTAPKWIDSPEHMRAGNWCDHWKQCVWFVPRNGIPISEGEDVVLHAAHTDTKILYEVGTSDQEELENRFSYRDFHLSLSPERIAIYGDIRWRSSMLEALRNAVMSLLIVNNPEKNNPVCVVADDSVFLTVLASCLSNKSRIIALFPGLREKGAEYLQAVAEANGFTPDRVQVFQKKKSLAMEDIDQRVDILIAEPYYYGNEGMLPWQNLRFWKERTTLDSLLSEDVIIMPCRAILRACAMSLPDLWSSRRSLSKVESFDHSIVNSTLGACGDLAGPEEGPLLPFFIWQCGYNKELSHAFTIMEFVISKPIAACRTQIQIEFTEPGICHGFALWVDWVMDANNSVVLSTGPDEKYWKQGVKLLSQPVTVGRPGSGDYHSTVIEASFDPSSGDLRMEHVFR